MIWRAFARWSRAGRGIVAGEGEAGVAEVGVALVQAEAAADGDRERLVEVLAGEVEGAGVGVESGTREEAEGEVVLLSGSAEAVDGAVEVGRGLGKVTDGAVALSRDDGRSAQGDMVESDVEEPVLFFRPREALRCARPHDRISALIEQEVAVPEAPERVEQRVGRLFLLLHPFGVIELRGRFLPPAHRVQDRCQIRPGGDAAEGVAASVGQLDAFPGPVQSFTQLTAGLEELAPVGCAYRGVPPVLVPNALIEAQPDQRCCLRQPAQCPQGEPRFIQHERLIGLTKSRRKLLPGGIEESREDGGRAPESPKRARSKVQVTALDALEIDLVESLLVLPGPAPVHDCRVQRLHLRDGLGPFLRRVS